MSEGHIYILNSYEKVLLINLFFSSNSKLLVLIPGYGEGRETAEDTFGPENINENEDVGGGIEVEFNTDATAMEGGLTLPKRGSKKAHHKEEISSYY